MIPSLRVAAILLSLALCTTVAAAGKTVRVLSIGNSFSGNATSFLKKMAEAGGNEWIFGHAMIGGSPFEKHLTCAKAFDAAPEDPEGKPYYVSIDGKTQKVSLRYLLESQPWEYVTVQQASYLSFKPETFEPHASQLVAYARRYAPQAKILIHETWPYREDHGIYKNGFTQAQMYRRLHDNYEWLGKYVDAVGVIPVGSAFQNLREDSRWKPSIARVDPAAYTHPATPPEDYELNVGYSWKKEKKGNVLAADRGHASTLGRFLGSCVWYEFFFGDVRNNTYIPPKITEQDAALLREIAHRTVAEGLRPKAATVAITAPASAPAAAKLPDIPAP